MIIGLFSRPVHNEPLVKSITNRLGQAGGENTIGKHEFFNNARAPPHGQLTTTPPHSQPRTLVACNIIRPPMRNIDPTKDLVISGFIDNHDQMWLIDTQIELTNTRY